MSREELIGKKFLKEINAKEADLILEALKQYGNDELIDKWISVKIIASEARKMKDNNTILPPSYFTDKQDPEATQRLMNLSNELRNNKE